MATYSSMLSWKIPWTEKPGGLYSPWGRKASDRTEQVTFSLFKINCSFTLFVQPQHDPERIKSLHDWSSCETVNQGGEDFKAPEILEDGLKSPEICQRITSQSQ